jgi:membrane protease YdiL (CAAX protease family)
MKRLMSTSVPPPPAPRSSTPPPRSPAPWDTGRGRRPAPGGPDGPSGLWRVLAALVMGLLGGLMLTLVVEIVGHAFGSPLAHPTPAVSLIGDYVFDIAFVGAALYFTFLGTARDPALLGFRRVGLRRALIAMVAAAIVYLIGTDVYGALAHIHGTDRLPSELGVNHHTAALVGATVFVCVFAPICEELFFRGFLFGGLSRSLSGVLGGGRGAAVAGPLLAALIVGVLFGLAHTGSASSQYLIPLGFLGFVLCLVRWRTRSIYPTIALHSLNNCVALGVNQLGWSAGEIAALALGSLAVIALLTAPLARARTSDGARAAL